MIEKRKNMEAMMQILYKNGKILTMEDAYPLAEAVLIQNGRIKGVGKKGAGRCSGCWI